MILCSSNVNEKKYKIKKTGKIRKEKSIAIAKRIYLQNAINFEPLTNT